MKTLPARQAVFVQEYLKDLNATQAAMRAGYSKTTATKQGPRLLTNVGIAAAIAKLQKERADKLEITAEKVLREWAILAFSDLQNYIEINNDTGAIRVKDFKEMPENASRALESITEIRTVREDAKGEDSIINERVTFKMHNKPAALEALSKHLGLFEKDKAPLFPANMKWVWVYADEEKPKGK
jgi:phage terminase small subunit